jgi:hypothetical protein
MANLRHGRANDAHRFALDARLRRLKMTATAAAAGICLGLWALVAGGVAGSSSASSLSTPPAGPIVDFFGSNGSSIGTTDQTPVLRSHGS